MSITEPLVQTVEGIKGDIQEMQNCRSAVHDNDTKLSKHAALKAALSLGFVAVLTVLGVFPKLFVSDRKGFS